MNKERQQPPPLKSFFDRLIRTYELDYKPQIFLGHDLIVSNKKIGKLLQTFGNSPF
jgi:hypothetical protein